VTQATFRQPQTRARIAVAVLLCLLLQGWFALGVAVRMAAGAEVCSVDGARRVASAGADCQQTCCHGVAGQALAPTPARVATLARPPLPRAAVLPAGRLALEWAMPLSRGPPRLETI